jgi:Domain of unknown function (DUF4112)
VTAGLSARDAATGRRAGRVLDDAERRRYRRVEQLADLLDNAIRIPGTPWRIGLDPLLGLIPGLGDAIGAAASSWILIEAARFGVSPAVLLRMLYNIAIDTVVGAVPGPGDLFDFVWKSDAKNVALLRRHLDQPGETRRASRRLLIGVIVALVGLSTGAVIGAALLIKYLLALSHHF